MIILNGQYGHKGLFPSDILTSLLALSGDCHDAETTESASHIRAISVDEVYGQPQSRLIKLSVGGATNQSFSARQWLIFVQRKEEEVYGDLEYRTTGKTS